MLIDKILNFYSSSKGLWIKKNFWIIFNLLILVTIPFFAIIRYVFKIRFVKLHRENRIGHLAGDIEMFLRDFELSEKKSNIKNVIILNNNFGNKYLVKMFKRKIKIIIYPEFFEEAFVQVFFSKNSFLTKLDFLKHLPSHIFAYKQFSYKKPMLIFTDEEEKEGQKLLKKMGIKKKNWFICFHARDFSYASKKLPNRDYQSNNFRDCSINNYVEGIKYINFEGGFALRMGEIVNEDLKKDFKNKKIIEYSKKFRSDFGDIYLSSKCKFFLASTAGLMLVPEIFNIPVAHTNLIPYKFPPLRKEDIFIPKKIWSKKKKRFLTFKEIINSKIIDFTRTIQYKMMELEVIENNSQEILDLTMEMNERLNGTWKETKEDKILQKKYKNLFKNEVCKDFPSQIGAKFLRENKTLLE